jgi:hypothetical protein
LTSTKRRYRGRKSSNLPGIGLIIILCACALADGLMVAYPLQVATAVLGGMVLAGGCLVWMGNR